MFHNQRSGNGVLLLGMGVLMAVWMMTAGLMWKTFHEGGASSDCQVACNAGVKALGHS